MLAIPSAKFHAPIIRRADHRKYAFEHAVFASLRGDVAPNHLQVGAFGLDSVLRLKPQLWHICRELLTNLGDKLVATGVSRAYDSLVGLGRKAQAAAAVRQYVNIVPDDVRGHLLLAKRLIDAGQKKEAALSIEQALKLTPDNAEAKAMAAAL